MSGFTEKLAADAVKLNFIPAYEQGAFALELEAAHNSKVPMYSVAHTYAAQDLRNKYENAERMTRTLPPVMKLAAGWGAFFLSRLVLMKMRNGCGYDAQALSLAGAPLRWGGRICAAAFTFLAGEDLLKWAKNEPTAYTDKIAYLNKALQE